MKYPHLTPNPDPFIRENKTPVCFQVIPQVPGIESHLAQTVCSNVPDVAVDPTSYSRGFLSASAPFPVCTVTRKGSGRAWQERRYLESVSGLAVPGSHKIASVKNIPLQNAAGCQFVRQPDADPFRPAGCHLAEELKSLEDPFFPDLRISELATCSGRRMRGGRTRGRSEGGVSPAFAAA